MIGFLKKFKDMIPELFQIIILGVLALLALYNNLKNNTDIVDILEVLLPMSLVILAVFLLVQKKQMLLALIVFFVTMFNSGVRDLIYAIFSYHFSLKDFLIDIKFDLIIAFVASLYLMMLIISYALSNDKKFELDYKPIAFPLFIIIIFTYFCFGFGSTMIIILMTLLTMSGGSVLAALAIMLSYVIDHPFNMFNRFIDDTTKFSTLFEWLTYAGAFYVIYVLVMAMIKQFKAEPIKLTIPVEKKEE
jgi:hypothetical protein